MKTSLANSVNLTLVFIKCTTRKSSLALIREILECELLPLSCKSSQIAHRWEEWVWYRIWTDFQWLTNLNLPPQWSCDRSLSEATSNLDWRMLKRAPKISCSAQPPAAMTVVRTCLSSGSRSSQSFRTTKCNLCRWNQNRRRITRINLQGLITYRLWIRARSATLDLRVCDRRTSPSWSFPTVERHRTHALDLYRN